MRFLHGKQGDVDITQVSIFMLMSIESCILPRIMILPFCGYVKAFINCRKRVQIVNIQIHIESAARTRRLKYLPSEIVFEMLISKDILVYLAVITWHH